MNDGRIARVSRAAVMATLLAGGAALAGPRGGPVGNAERPIPPALDAPKPCATDGAVVQLALLLDTSNSMDGLIDQARSHLWAVVNDLACLRHECKPVQLQVALFQYGNDGLESSDGFVQLRAPFTTDLDVISEQLFALRTKGGSEYCAWVIREAADRLEWIPPAAADGHAKAPVMRLIVIAGNEPFTQGSVPYSSSIPTATNKGITVHTVFCGTQSEGAATYWDDGATLGEGRFFSIDHNQCRIEVETPFDGRISSLNSRLNETYVPYGARGREAQARQMAQDSLNSGDRYASNARAAAKSGALYVNGVWDLVDAMREEGFDLSKVERSTLPEPVRDLADDELAAALNEKFVERSKIQAEVRELMAERSRFLAEKQPDAAPQGLGAALASAIMEKAQEKGLTRGEKQ